MKAPNITPGPWNLMKCRTLLHVETDASNPTGAGISICSIPKRADGTGEANARAIASVPALLSALESAYKIADAWCCETNPHGDLVRGDSMEHDGALCHREAMRTALEAAGYSFDS